MYLGKAATTRVGLDGSWVGMNQGKSYFFVSIDPGDHHLCIAQQSGVKTSDVSSAISLTAQAGKVYYFRAEVEERLEHQSAVKLEPIDSAEGQLLIASSSLSSFHPKN